MGTKDLKFKQQHFGKLIKGHRRHHGQAPDNNIQRCPSPENPKFSIKVPINISRKPDVELLIDTGADISLIKKSALNKSTKISNKKIEINCAFGKDNTLGKCKGIIKTPLPKTCEFHIIKDNQNIPGDGVLGNNFLSKNCNIEGPNQLLRFPKTKANPIEFTVPLNRVSHLDSTHLNSTHIPSQNDSEITSSDKNPVQGSATSNLFAKLSLVDEKFEPKPVKIPTPILKESLKVENTKETVHGSEVNSINLIPNFKARYDETPREIRIPARTETLVQIPTEAVGDNVCLSQEIRPGVFLSNCLVRPTNKKVVVSVLNATETNQTFEKINLNLLPISEFMIKAINPNLNPALTQTQPNKQYCKDLKSNKNADIFCVTLQNERTSFLEKEVIHENLNSEERESLLSICEEYSDIFYLPGDKLTHTNVIEHTIPIKTDHPPVNQKMYRLPEKQKLIIQEQVQDMLENDIIEPSKSPWNSPLLVVPKKDGPQGEKKWRVVVDFRRLNAITIGDAFPLPRIEEILDQLGHSRYFTTLDLASGYHQVLVNEEDRLKTAFSTNLGHYQFKRMPFGLSGAPATFQRLMNHILAGLQGFKCFVYLDDIVIYGRNLIDHNQKLKAIFDRLRESNLKLQPSKCQFLRKEVVYLGHICTERGVFPDPSKTKCVQDFPTPRTVRQVQSFLGLSNYYRKFIPNFSKIAEPIQKLLHKGTKFKWTEECQHAFKTLKHALVNPPLLIYPDFSKPFILTTDASGEALGAVLSQGKIGEDQPIAYASRSLNKAERNYSTIERELLAIVWATRNFRCYLYGRNFTVFTDHKPLIGVFNTKDPTSRLVRFHHKLSEFNYEIKYKPGKYNKNADGLSRIPEKNNVEEILVEEIHQQTNGKHNKCYKSHNTTKKESSNAPTVKKNIEDLIVVKAQVHHCMDSDIDNDSVKSIACHVMTRAQTRKNSAKQPSKPNTERGQDSSPTTSLSSSDEESLANILESDTESLLHETDSGIKTLNSPEDINTVLKDFHNSTLGGHTGVYKTYKRIRKQFKWKHMMRDIREYVKKCLICQKNKSGKQTKMEMMISDTAQKPFEKVYLDIVGPLPVSEKGSKYILTFLDDLTRFFDCFAICDAEAITVANCFYKNIILRYQIPKRLITDQGSNFTSNLFKEVCKILKVKKIQTTAYHPQSNGALERAHGPLIDYLRSFVDNKPEKWDDWLAEAAYVHNNTIHAGTKMTPMEALYGFCNSLPTNLKQEPEPIYNFDSYCNYIKYKMQTTHKIARENLVKSKEASKKYYDRHTNIIKLHVGDRVLLRNEQKKHKLSPIWTGPYEVKRVDNPINCTIQIGKKLRRVHNNRLKKF